MASFRKNGGGPPEKGMDVAEALKNLQVSKNNEQIALAEKKAQARKPEEIIEEELDFNLLYKANQGSRFEYVETNLKTNNRPNALKGLNASLGTSPTAINGENNAAAKSRRVNLLQRDEARFGIFSEMAETASDIQKGSIQPPSAPSLPSGIPATDQFTSTSTMTPEERRTVMKQQVEELSQRCHLARNLRELDKLSEAEAEFRVCLRMLIGLLGPTHMETIRCMQNLAECLFAQGELQLAETMYRECLEGIELNVGTDHIEVVRTSNSLGVVLEQQGKMVEAKAMYLRAIEGRDKLQGPLNPATLKAIHNYALFLQCCGDLEEAEDMHVKAALGFEESLGCMHADTMKAVNSLAKAYNMLDKKVQSESMYCRLISCKAKLYGANHLSTLTSICNLATVLYDNGKLRGASDNLICAMAGYSYLLGPGHDTVNELYNALREIWDHDETRTKEVIEYYKYLLAKKPSTAPAEHLLKKVLDKMKVKKEVQERKIDSNLDHNQPST